MAAMLNRGFSNELQYDALEDELYNGKSTLIMTNSGEVQRVVGIMVLRLQRVDDGSIFVQLGKCSRTATAVCKLPGTKIASGETPTDTLNRVVTELPSAYAREMRVTSQERVEEWNHSATHCIRSMYIKTVHMASINPHDCEDDVDDTPSDNFIFRKNIRQLLRGLELEVIIVINGTSVFINAWLQEADLTFFGGQSGKPMLQEWLSSDEVQNAVHSALAKRRSVVGESYGSERSGRSGSESQSRSGDGAMSPPSPPCRQGGTSARGVALAGGGAGGSGEDHDGGIQLEWASEMSSI